MKYYTIITLFALTVIACNNAEQGGNATNTANVPKTHEDSLLKDVMHGHDVTMAKTSKISAAQQKVQHALDSVNKLSAKAKEATKSYLQQLDSLSEKLKYADFSMNKWMDEFNYDSAANGTNRSAYLESEKKKISAIEDAMASALHLADSLFKK